MTKEIYQYVRKDNKFVGVLVGTKLDDGTVRITASKSNKSRGDTFDKALGLKIARSRANNSKTVIAHSMLPEMVAFNDRCSRYFKVNPTDIDTPVPRLGEPSPTLGIIQPSMYDILGIARH